MKITVSAMLIAFILSFGFPSSHADSPYTDIKETDWFYTAVTILTSLNIIDGYPQGDFKPEDSINADAFIKMTVTALGHTDLKNGPSYWASNFIAKACDLGLVLYGEFENYNRPITRFEMARIIVRALPESYPSDLNIYSGLIKDYCTISSYYRPFILKAFCKGILTGYPDGSFKGKETSSRAEAATVIYRMIEPAARAVVNLPAPSPTPAVTATPTPANTNTVQYLPPSEVNRLRHQYDYNTDSNLVYSIDEKKLVSDHKNFNTFMSIHGYQKAAYCVYIATSHMNTINNVNYADYNKQEYKDRLGIAINPENLSFYAENRINDIDIFKIHVEGQFYSHPSLVYVCHEGRMRVRGKIKYIVHSCDDVERFYGAGVPVDKWVEEDCEIELSLMGSWYTAGPYFRRGIFIGDIRYLD